MAYQSAANIDVAIKRETTTGTAATASGATQVRIIDSPGLELKRSQIQSAEKRDDGLKTLGRLGGKMVDGSYNAELTIGGATDIMLEAIMRSTWVTSTALTFATLTSVTVGSNEVVAAGGSWITQGIRVGDIFHLNNYATAANNGINARVTALTTLTISVATNTFTAGGGADVAGTLTVLKKLASATTPTNYSHTVEQYDRDIDLSELFLGCRAIGVKLSLRPNAMSTATYTFMGMDRTALATGTSPWFTSPSLTTGIGLISDDSAIRYNGAQVATFTSLDLEWQIAAKAESVMGSFVPPDVFLNDMMVTGSISGLRSDFSNLTLFDAETEFELSFKLEEPSTSTPKPCLAFFLPRVKIGALSAPVGGGDGAKIETLQLMIGPKVSSSTYDAGIMTIHSSAA